MGNIFQIVNSYKKINDLEKEIHELKTELNLMKYNLDCINDRFSDMKFKPLINEELFAYKINHKELFEYNKFYN